ncbi:MAG: hypothetical protein WEA99_06765 [Brumimicrobium sp.]
MKTLIYGGLFLATVGIGLAGCKKELQSNRTKINYEIDNIPLISTSEGKTNVNKNDKDEIKLNKQLKDLAISTKEFINDLEFNRIIIKLAKESGTESVYYSQLKQEAPEYYNRINQNLRGLGTSIEEITTNMTHEPLNPNPKYPETEELEVYEPAIMVPNTEILDPKKIPLISPNVEKVFKNKVYIKSYFYKESSEIDSTLIGEETTFKTSNPIFILNHAMPYKEMKKLGDFLKNNKRGSSSNNLKTNTGARVSQVSINGYPYEQGAFNWHSEFCINAVVVYDNGNANYIYYQQTGINRALNGDYSKKLAEIQTVEAMHGSLINVDYSFSPDYSNNNAYVGVYWNTFERDWNRSREFLGYSNPSYPYTWYIEGNMRYAGDWYQWVPSTTRDHSFPYNWFGWETSIKFESWKSSITIVPS